MLETRFPGPAGSGWRSKGVQIPPVYSARSPGALKGKEGLVLNILTTVKGGGNPGKTRALQNLSSMGPLGLRTDRGWGLTE